MEQSDNENMDTGVACTGENVSACANNSRDHANNSPTTTNTSNPMVVDDDDDAGDGTDLAIESDEDDVDEQFVDSENDEEDEYDTKPKQRKHLKPKAGEQSQSIPEAAGTVFGDFSFTGPRREDKSADDSEIFKGLNAEKAEKWVNEDVCNTALVNTQQRFVCVKYPGVIRNKDKAVMSLGGIGAILDGRELDKVDLHFRPGDPYCKPTVGLYKKNNHLLIRCKRRKVVPGPSTSHANDDVGEDEYEYKIEAIGIVEGIFSFNLPCDYQYLPVARKSKDAGFNELLSEIKIQFEVDRQTYMNRDTPLFLPPFVFSRSERPAKYNFQDDEERKDDFIGQMRKTRSKGTQRVLFSSKEIPNGPNQDALVRLKTMFNNVNLDPLRQLFEERPLWSKVGIISRLRLIDKITLKDTLNAVAYYFGNGPWIHLWCKFGYDPRKDVNAKFYQTIDFRIRKVWYREQVTAKRPGDHIRSMHRFNTIQGHKILPMREVGKISGGGVGSSGGDGSGSSKEGVETEEREIDLHYQFIPGQLPPYRQMYYQLCDVFEERIQALAHKNDGQETECTEHDGWCVQDFTNLSRDIITECTKSVLDESRDQQEKS